MRLSLFTLLWAVSLMAESWSLEKAKEGITLYSRPFEQTHFRETKGVLVVDAPLREVVAIIEDVSLRTRWFEVYKKVAEVHYKNENFVHTVTKMPFPLKDRETVWKKISVAYDSTTGVYHNRFEATTPEEYPLTSHHIRVTHAKGAWYVQEISPYKTEVVYQFFIDPAGGIPRGLANAAATTIPVKALKAIKRAVDSHYYEQTLSASVD